MSRSKILDTLEFDEIQIVAKSIFLGKNASSSHGIHNGWTPEVDIRFYYKKNLIHFDTETDMSAAITIINHYYQEAHEIMKLKAPILDGMNYCDQEGCIDVATNIIECDLYIESIPKVTKRFCDKHKINK